jgi:CBS domain-containing protein
VYEVKQKDLGKEFPRVLDSAYKAPIRKLAGIITARDLVEAYAK